MTRVSDEAVEALSVSLIGAPWTTFDEGLLNTLRAVHREALEAALPHLTDDGAADTPPADQTVQQVFEHLGSGVAAERATTTVAPSSPHREYAISVLVDLLQEANRRDVRALASQGYPGIPEVPDDAMQAHCGHPCRRPRSSRRDCGCLMRWLIAVAVVAALWMLYRTGSW